MENNILIVEDELSAAELLRDYLSASGYGVDVCYDGNGVVEYVRNNSPSLILLDIMLPGKDGITICQEIRTFSSVPIIMVTARIDEIDRLLGLELGADDYICKPYSPREVVARVKAVLRRVKPDRSYDGQIQIDHKGHRILFEGKDLELTAVEFQLFASLFKRPGRIFSRDQLIHTIYPDQRIVNDRTIDSHIKKLRLKIAKVRQGIELIHSVYGIGYKYEEP